MEPRRVAFSVLVAAICVVVALVAYEVGRSGLKTESQAATIETAARKKAVVRARKAAFESGRQRGYGAGLEAGRRKGVAAGTRKGTKNGLAVFEQTAPPAPVTTPGTTTPPTGPTPSVDSPEGKRLLEESPDCEGLPPPPPDYHGPVQC